MNREIFTRKLKVFTKKDEIKLGIKIEKWIANEQERWLRKETKEEDKRTKKALERLKQFKYEDPTS